MIYVGLCQVFCLKIRWKPYLEQDVLFNKCELVQQIKYHFVKYITIHTP